MNVWFVNYYCSPPEFDTHGRHLAFAKCLQERGHQVTIFMAGSHAKHDFVDDFEGITYKKVVYGDYTFVHVKCNHYEGNGLKRMLSLFQFAQRFKRIRNKFEKPDVILHNMHAPFDYPVCKCAKKLGVRYIAEEWDLWPENFVRVGLIPERSIVTRWAFSIERRMYEFASDVIGTDAGLLDYWREKGWSGKTGGTLDENKFHYINNGVDLNSFNVNRLQQSISDDDLSNDSIFKVIYLGSINLANDVQKLIDAFSKIKEYPNIQLLVYGDGSQRDMLEQYCAEKKIKNVVFKQKHITYPQCAYVVSRADLNIMNYTKNFALRGLSAGKLMLSLAAGKPMICNVKIGYDDVISDNNIGICDDLDTPEKYAEAILGIYRLSKKDYDEMCLRVSSVSKMFDYAYLSNQFVKVIENHNAH